MSTDHTLKDHADEDADWDAGRRAADRALFDWLYGWARRLNEALGLGLRLLPVQTEDFGPRPGPGWRGGLGRSHPLSFDRRWLLAAAPAARLVALLRGLLHEWQLVYGRRSKCPRYHNRQFRAKGRSFGVVFNDHGRLIDVKPGPFTAVLEANGVDQAGLGLPRKRPRGKGRLKRWRCGCSVAWVARDMRALCERCGQRYRRAGNVDGARALYVDEKPERD
jgi:hypothetical protein